MRQGEAFWYGGAIAAVNTLFMGVRLQSLPDDLGKAQARIMGGVVQRFVFTLLALVAAFTWFRLPPEGLILGLVVGHLILAVNAVTLRWRREIK